MIGYAMLGSNDVSRARAFYDAVLPLLGASVIEAWSDADRIWYGVGSGAPLLAITRPLDGRSAEVGNGSMLALMAPSHAVVRAVHARAIDLGGVDEGAPGFRGSPPGRDPEDLYRAYFRDLDGHKLAVFAGSAHPS